MAPTSSFSRVSPYPISTTATSSSDAVRLRSVPRRELRTPKCSRRVLRNRMPIAPHRHPALLFLTLPTLLGNGHVPFILQGARQPHGFLPRRPARCRPAQRPDQYPLSLRLPLHDGGLRPGPAEPQHSDARRPLGHHPHPV